MLSDEEKAVLKTAKENYGLTSAEQKILVNLIEKLFKEIEELKEKFSETYEYFKRDFTPNDKIKAKIESVDYSDYSKAERIAMKEVLQSLLEKE